jgi:hypothetical protein
MFSHCGLRAEQGLLTQKEGSLGVPNDRWVLNKGTPGRHQQALSYQPCAFMGSSEHLTTSLPGRSHHPSFDTEERQGHTASKCCLWIQVEVQVQCIFIIAHVGHRNVCDDL